MVLFALVGWLRCWLVLILVNVGLYWCLGGGYVVGVLLSGWLSWG